VNVVLDTNVLVSAMLTAMGNCEQIVEKALVGELRFCYDGRMLEEYKRVLSKPQFSFDKGRVRMVLGSVVQKGLPVIARATSFALPHEKDRCFLEVAMTVPVDALVTGNFKHFPAENRHGVQVVAPADFGKAYASWMKAKQV
jgi:putative PIN family toxin of toxin-antitoxin system